MFRSAAFWTALLALPFAIIAILTYLPDSMVANVPTPVVIIVMEVLALTPGIILMVSSKWSRQTKLLGSALYAPAFGTLLPFAFFAIGCSLHLCDF